MIDFTTILREDEHAYVVTISLPAVIDFLRGGAPSVVLVDGNGISLCQRRNAGSAELLHRTLPHRNSRFVERTRFRTKVLVVP